jgi:tripartite-type tricarboxylate transporter receptor subunit TctC
MTGVKLLAVSYRGGAPALADLLSGEVQAMLCAPVVTSARRPPSQPDVPTIGEFVPEGNVMVRDRRTKKAPEIIEVVN